MKVWISITTEDGEELERFAVISGDPRDGHQDLEEATEAQAAGQIRDQIERRFATQE